MEECKGCRGCVTLSQGGRCVSDLIPRISETEECPCITCLVKTMCLVTCEEFNAYNVRCVKIKQFKQAIENGK